MIIKIFIHEYKNAIKKIKQVNNVYKELNKLKKLYLMGAL